MLNINTVKMAPNFTSKTATQKDVKSDVTKPDITSDSVKFSTEDTDKKTGALDKTKGAITGVQKFFITCGEMTKGIVKGLFYGAMTGATVLGGNIVYRASKKVPKEVEIKIVNEKNIEIGTKVVQKMVRRGFEGLKPLVKKSGIALAVTSGLGVMAFEMVKAKLDANTKTADVDHRWRVGHRDK